MIGLLLLQSVSTFIPAGARSYAPVLVAQQQQAWAQAPEPWTLAGQIEQESCVTLRSPRCWDPKAELKTSREYGFGFGQITVAYRADGSERFNNFSSLSEAHAALRGWAWTDRFDPARQLLAVVLMDRAAFGRQHGAATVEDSLAFLLAAYNGGEGGLLQDRRLCGNTKGCNPGRWFGHVERTSLKTRLIHPGYGESAFQINRNYVLQILVVRRTKYRRYWP